MIQVAEYPQKLTSNRRSTQAARRNNIVIYMRLTIAAERNVPLSCVSSTLTQETGE